MTDDTNAWDDADLYHDWTSPCGTYHVQTRLAGVSQSRTYLNYRLSCRGVIVFQGSDYSGSPMHADDSWATLAGLLSFLSMRPGDTDREYFDDYIPEQLAFAREHGEMLSLCAHEMES